MKGIVFSEFVEMVEERFSPSLADKIIAEAELPSGGAYSAVGTYDHQEMLRLVERLSTNTGIAAAELFAAFGRHLAQRFHDLYPSFFANANDTFSFLCTIEKHVHTQVLKLYPDAELPTFDTANEDANQLRMIYRSKRPFADLAEGLIQGSAAHYDETLSIQREDSRDGEYYITVFDLTRQAE